MEDDLHESAPASADAPKVVHRLVRRTSGLIGANVVLPMLCALTDLVLMLTSLLAAARMRTSLPFLDGANDVHALVTALGGFIVAGWLLGLWAVGSYAPHLLSAGLEEYKKVINGSVVTAGGVGIVCYLAKIPLSRGFFAMAFLIGIPLLLLGRFLLRRALHRWRMRGLFLQRVVVVGDAARVDEITAAMRREAWLGYNIVGALAPRRGDHQIGDTTDLGVPYLGSLDEAPTLAAQVKADILIITTRGYDDSSELRRLQWDLEHQHVQVIVAPNVTDVARERVVLRPVAGLPLVHLERPQGLEASRWAKRAFDVVVGSALVVLTAPLMLIGFLAVRLHDHGPVLFRQTRIGRDGVPFQMVKFRSMVVDAEARRAEVEALNQSDQSGVLFKSSHDPRITKPGRWMRRYSIDELPQLFNVVRGDMSLVGPRPALAIEVEQYSSDMVRRLRVRPGITGLWQVSGRSDLPWSETVRLDLYYVDNWSMFQDLAILLKTLQVVLRADGAY